MEKTLPNSPESFSNSEKSIAIAAIFRNECSYVLEWIAHHRVLGVRHFYIADNISDDGTSELLSALDATGIIKRIPYPTQPGKAPQLPAYAEILKNHAYMHDWVTLIDADEFLMPMNDQKSILGAIEEVTQDEHIGAIAVNWATYGSSWLLNHSAGLVLERFQRRATQSFIPNHHYKTILRMAAFESVGGNPHYFVLKPGWRYVHTNGSIVEHHEKHGVGLSTHVVWEKIRLNHHIIKSKEEFETNKRRKGRATNLTSNTRDNEHYFVGFDRNDVFDPAPEWLLKAVHEEFVHLKERLLGAGHEIPLERNNPPEYSTAPLKGGRGHIDRMEWKDGMLHLRGWAFDAHGKPASHFLLEGEPLSINLENKTRLNRPDMQRQLPMVALNCGFHLVIENPHATPATETIRVFGVRDDDTAFGPFTITSQSSA